MGVIKNSLVFRQHEQIGCLQEVDESGAEVFTTLLPSGTPLPARRHHVLTGQGTLSSVSIDVYQRWVLRPPEKLAKVRNSVLHSNLMSRAEIVESAKFQEPKAPFLSVAMRPVM